jgi:peptidylprolyl isomerase
MFKRNILALISTTSLLISFPGCAQQQQTAPTPPQEAVTPAEQPQIDIKKLSEAFGNFIGKNLKTPGISFDLESLIKGIRDGAAGKPSPLNEQEYEDMMAAFQEKAFKEIATRNLKNANEFMTKNANEQGVVEIEPGKLQYFILREGSGPAVTQQSTPMINYTGKYLDGSIFGSSEEVGGPITIPINQTIPGFSKGVLGMKEGEKRRLFVHPDFGYGTTGQLPPNELLIFEIEVIKADAKPASSTRDTSPDVSQSDDDNDDNDDGDDDNGNDNDYRPRY